MNARCVFLALGLTLVLLPHRGSAQVVETPEGTVEFIGLERWTIEMIRDSMVVKAPGEPLGRCAAFLVQVGFPTANALYLSGENGKPYILVTVVEPHRADRVRTRSSFRDSLPDHLEWKKGINLFHEKNPAFQRGGPGDAHSNSRLSRAGSHAHPKRGRRSPARLLTRASSTRAQGCPRVLGSPRRHGPRVFS